MKKFLEQYGMWILGSIVVVVLVAIVAVVSINSNKNIVETPDQIDDVVNKVEVVEKEFKPVITISQTETDGKFHVEVMSDSTQDAISLEYRIKDLNGNWSAFTKVDGELSTGENNHVGDFAVKIENGFSIQARIYLTKNPDDKFNSDILTYTGKKSTRETAIIAPYSTLIIETGAYVFNEVLNVPDKLVSDAFNFVSAQGSEAVEYTSMSMSKTNGLRYTKADKKYAQAYSVGTTKWAKDSKIRIIVVSENQTVSKEFKEWFAENAVKSSEYSLLHFNLNGGKMDTTMRIMKTEELYSTLPTPTKTGYTFDAWYTAKDTGDKVGMLTKMGTQNTTVFAHYKPAAIKLAGNKYSFAYASAATVTLKATNGVGDYSYNIISQETESGSKIDKFSIVGDKLKMSKDTELGTYVIKVQAEDKETHQKAEGTYTITVVKASIGIPGISNAIRTWTGDVLAPSFTTNSLLTIGGSTSATNVGKYTITYEIKDKSRYVWSDGSSDTITLNWEIKKASPDIDDPKPLSLTYTGKAQKLIEPGLTTSGTVMYRLAGTTSWTSEVPTGTDKGKYKIQYYVAGDKSHEDSDVKTIEAGIDVAIVEVPKNGLARTYDGTTMTHNISIPSIATVVSSSSTLKASNAGTYKVTLAINNNCIWADGTSGDKEMIWVVLPASINDATITMDTKDYTYNGSEINPYAVVKIKDKVLVEGTDYYKEIENGTSAGEATLKIIGKNNYLGTISAKYNIQNAEMKYVVVANPCEYTGEATNCNAYVKVSKPTTGYSIKYGLAEGTYDLDEIPTFTDAGEHNVYYEIKADNYVTIHDKLTVTINKKTALFSKMPVIKKSLKYDGSYQDLIDEGETNDGNIWYRFANEEWTAEVPSAKKAGTYVIEFYIEGDKNHNNSQIYSLRNVTLSKLSVSIPNLTQSSLTYTGETIAANIANYNPDLMDQIGIVSAVDAGSYKITWSLKDTVNYQWNDGSITDKEIIWNIYPAIAEFVKPQAKTIPYDGDAHELIIPGSTNHGTIVYSFTGSKDSSEWFTEIPTATEKGTYAIYYKILADSNHKDSSSMAIVSKITD